MIATATLYTTYDIVYIHVGIPMYDVIYMSLPAMKWRRFHVFAPKLEITGDGPGARDGDPAVSE